jgi:hypothetical protein
MLFVFRAEGVFEVRQLGCRRGYGLAENLAFWPI